MKALQIFTVCASIIILALSIVALCKTIYDGTYEEGFNACIEENNLYERYDTNGKE